MYHPLMSVGAYLSRAFTFPITVRSTVYVYDVDFKIVFDYWHIATSQHHHYAELSESIKQN